MKALILLVISALIFLGSCGSTIIPDPEFVYIDVADSVAVSVDFLFIRTGPGLVPVIPDIPTYIELGNWEFVLLPDIMPDTIGVH